MKIYSQSDIHGFLAPLKQNIASINLEANVQLVFLGDYIDYGPKSRQTLEYLMNLQKKYGIEKIVILKGNHEKMFLDWLEEYSDINHHITGLEKYSNKEWLQSDKDADYETLKTFLSKEQWKQFCKLEHMYSMDSLNCEAVKLLMENHRELIAWLAQLPYYYETEKQIFVHAGIAEWAGEEWECVTSDECFVEKYPPTKGKFYKDIIAGHVSTAKITGDKNFFGIYFDGESHYYIDGETYKSGVIPVLEYDTEKEQYLQIQNLNCAT